MLSTENQKAQEKPSIIKYRQDFFGMIELDSTRLARDAGRVAEEIVQHLTSIIGSDVKVTLEIEANISTGVPDYVIKQ